MVGLFILLLAYGLYLWRWLPLDKPTSGLLAIVAAIDLYKQTYKTYPPTVSALGGAPATCAKVATPDAACLIDNVLASGEKSGYSIRYKATDTTQNGRPDGFTATADPVSGGSPGQRHYFADYTGVIRVETGRPATAASPRAD